MAARRTKASKGNGKRTKAAPPQAPMAPLVDPKDIVLGEELASANGLEPAMEAPLGAGLDAGEIAELEPQEDEPDETPAPLPDDVVEAHADPNAPDDVVPPVLPVDAQRSGGKVIYIQMNLTLGYKGHRFHLHRGDKLPGGTLSKQRIRKLASMGVLSTRKPRLKPKVQRASLRA